MIRVNTDFVPKDDFYFLVSGGVDSIAAAHWMKHKFNRKCKLLHFNHKVQPINDEMYDKTFQFCMDFDFGGRFIDRDLDVEPAFIDITEAGLRDWRQYKMRGIGGNFVTAHHLNDCIESYLMNCFHGTPEYQPIPWNTMIPFSHTLWHPFLNTVKRDLIHYAFENDLMKYVVEDPTNKDTGPKRNWVRNVIVPQLDSRCMGIETIVRRKFYTIKTEIP